jgi:hypothetical protein
MVKKSRFTKTALLSPTPSASVATATTETSGWRASERVT